MHYDNQSTLQYSKRYETNVDTSVDRCPSTGFIKLTHDLAYLNARRQFLPVPEEA